MGKPRLNKIFENMKQRCYNQNHIDYKNYGGRGIYLCDEWNNREKIGTSSKGWIAFKEWALLHGYTDELFIDRIDNNKGYSPENCRWVTMKVQQNNKQNSRLITYKGKTQTLAQWCNELGLNYRRIQSRLNLHHWSIEKALETNCDTRLRIIKYKNKTQSLTDWCKELNLDYIITWNRIYKYHWSVDRAFETKIVKHR